MPTSTCINSFISDYTPPDKYKSDLKTLLGQRAFDQNCGVTDTRCSAWVICWTKTDPVTQILDCQAHITRWPARRGTFLWRVVSLLKRGVVRKQTPGTVEMTEPRSPSCCVCFCFSCRKWSHPGEFVFLCSASFASESIFEWCLDFYYKLCSC